MPTQFDPSSLVLDKPVSANTAKTVSRIAALCGASSLHFSAVAVLRNSIATIRMTTSKFPEAMDFVAECMRDLESAITELEVHGSPDLSQISGFTTNKQPALSLLKNLTKDANLQIKETSGNLLVIGLLTGLPLPKNRSQRLLALVNAEKREPHLNSTQLLELQKLQTRSREELLEVLSLCLARTDRTYLRFNATLLIHLRSTLNSQHEEEQRSANIRRFFTKAEVVNHVRNLKDSVQAGNLQSLTTLLAFSLGLPYALTMDIPLISGNRQPGIVAWIDVSDGLAYVSTQLLLKELGRPTQGSKETSDLYQLCLPDFVAIQLRLARFVSPTARTVGELGGEDFFVSSELNEYWTDSTRGKLIRSAAVLSLNESKNRVTTAYAFLAFHLITSSDLHYLHVDQSQINQLREEVFIAAGFGGTTRIRGSVNSAIGSKRTATEDTIRAVFAELDAAVSEVKIGRRYSPTSLIDYHNKYTHRVAMFVHLIAGGRGVSTLDFPASSWFSGSIFGFIDDKAAGASGGKTPIPITPLMCEQLRLWERHLLSLEQRLMKSFGAKASEALHRIKEIINNGEPSIFFFLREDASIQEVHTGDLFVGAALHLNRDWGRHLIASALVKQDATLAQVHRFLRHQGGAVNPHSALGVDTPHDHLLQLAQRMDSYLESVPLQPLPGLGGSSQ